MIGQTQLEGAERERESERGREGEREVLVDGRIGRHAGRQTDRLILG